MKYLWIVVVIALLVRIDVVMKLVDKGIDKFQNRSKAAVQSPDLIAKSELVPFSEDKTLKQTPKKIFFSLLHNFHQSPDKGIRDRAMLELRKHQNMFTTVLDKELESQVYHWRDLVIQGDGETAQFLLDLMSTLQGENYDMVRKFFSLWIDVDLEQFLKFYGRSNDKNCGVMTLLADPVPEEEKLSEYIERETDLNALLTNDKIDVVTKKYADICLLVVKVQIGKFSPNSSIVPEAVPILPEGIRP